MARLEKITIERFKSIRELREFGLKDVNILIGANGSGKSNFISAFSFLHTIADGNLQLTTGKFGGASRLLHYGPKSSPSIKFWLRFNGNGYEVELHPTAQDSLVFAQENCLFWGRSQYAGPYVEDLGTGHTESLLKKTANSGTKVPKYVYHGLLSWSVYHFHDTSGTAPVKQTCSLHDNLFLRPNAGNLAAVLYLMSKKDKDAYDNIVDAIRRVAPFFDDFVLRPSPFNKDEIRLEWKEKGSDMPFGADSLSDGTLRFICLATLLLQSVTPSIVIIDEPELGLHPQAVSQLAALMKSVSNSVQIIASTQSVTLVNQFYPSQLIIVDRETGEKGQSTFRRADDESMESWLEDYALGDLWEKNLLGGRPQPMLRKKTT